MTPPKTLARPELEQDPLLPLALMIHCRVTKAAYANIFARSLSEGVPESTVIRRWLRKGAAAEGIALDSLI